MNAVHKYTPLRITIPFILGIIAAISAGMASVTLQMTLMAYLVFFVGLLVTYLFFISNYNLRWLPGVMAYSALFAAAMTGVMIVDHDSSIKTAKLGSAGRLYICRINHAPVEKSGICSGNVTVLAQSDSSGIWNTVNTSIMTYFKDDSLCLSLRYGDLILFTASPQPIKDPANPHMFSYKKYLQNRQVFYQLYLEPGQWRKTGIRNVNPLLDFADRCRRTFLETFREFGITGQDFALVSALLLGNTEYLDAEIRQEFSYAGATHVLSVSGMHVAIVYIAADRMLFFLKRSRKSRKIYTSLIISFIWVYALITGLSTPVVRASLMFSLVAASNLLRRSSEGYNILAVSAFLQLWINPYDITQVGFQLSYLAVLGIFALYQPINEVISTKNRLVTWIWPVVAVSLAAQLATSPLAAYYFNMFPVYFLLTNLVVVPLSSLIIYFAIALLVLGAVGVTFHFLALPLQWSLWFMRESIGEIQSWPGAVIDSMVISGFQVILVYIVIAAAFGLFILRKRYWALLALSCCLLFLISRSIQKYRRISEKEIIVYSISGHAAIDLIDNRTAFFISDSSLMNNEKKLNFQVRPNRMHHGVKEVVGIEIERNIRVIEEDLFAAFPFFSFKGRKMVFINEDWQYFSPLNRMACDLVIISGKTMPDIERLRSQIDLKQVVIDSSVPSYLAVQLISLFEKAGISCHSVRQEGAFVVRWSGGQVVRWSGGQVVRWSGGQVVRRNGETVERWNSGTLKRLIPRPRRWVPGSIRTLS